MFKTSDIDLAAFLIIQGHQPVKVTAPEHAKFRQYTFEDAALHEIPKYSNSEFERFAHARVKLKHLPLTNQ